MKAIYFASLAILTAANTVQSQVKWEPLNEFDGQIFPSMLLSIATVNITNTQSDPNQIGDRLSTHGISIVNPSKNSRVKVVIGKNALIQESSFEGLLEKAGVEYNVRPKINWDYDALRAVKQSKPINFVFSLSLDGKEVGSKTKTFRVRSINDCLLFYKGTPFSFLFAAYVNEDHPGIDDLLKDALKTGIVSSFDGYQSNDPAQVYRQVLAIWTALQNQKIKYSSITQTASEPTQTLFSQHVRFLDESIKFAQANCVDGSVLMASILRKIGIDPVLVLIPGHCYVGYYADEEHKGVIYLETTLLGNEAVLKNAKVTALVESTDLFNLQSSRTHSQITFDAAIQSANENSQKYRSQFEAHVPGYFLIKIKEARQYGIMPIHFETKP